MKKATFSILLLLLVFVSSAQFTYIDISVDNPTQAAGEPFRIYMNSYDAAIIIWPVDRIEKREVLPTGGWGPWNIVSSPISPLGYDGTRYYYTTSIEKKSQFRWADAVSGGTAYSNELDIDIHDADKNWIESVTYDEAGNPVSKSRQYFDPSGDPKQIQSYDFVHSEVFASEPLFDDQDRNVGQTLGAPIGQTSFQYKSDFATVGGNKLTESNWKNGLPLPLDNTTPNTLGHYYGTNATIANTGLPYSVMSYYKDGSGEEKTSSVPGNAHYLKSGKNVVTKLVPMLNGELRHYAAIRDMLLQQTGCSLAKVMKQVVIDGNGNEAVAYIDDQQNTIASAISGGTTWTTPISWTLSGNPLDIHIPKGVSVNLTGQSQEVFDLKNEVNISGTAPTLNQGIYRLSNVSGTNQYYPNYTDHAYQFYNDRGQLIASMTPKGVQAVLDDVAANGSITYTATTLPYTTTYSYDFQGRLTSMTEPDAGTTKYSYRRDGQIRFSQNAEQLDININKDAEYVYSFTSYDDLGRPIESGEYHHNKADISAIPFNSLTSQHLEETGRRLHEGRTKWINENTARDWIKTYYDVSTLPSLPVEFSGSHALTQNFVQGAVSSTENEAIQSWYSYDDQGRVVWFLQEIKELNKFFLIEYTYDFLGNVTKVAFQPQTYGVSGMTNEAFFHQYTYDANQRLMRVETSVNDVNWYLQATYEYYKHGPLKRVVLAEDLQGVDYSYTPQGWLKAINHPIPEFDPGQDDGTTTSRDAFGMTLEYHDQDYTSGGVNFNLLNADDATFPDQYNGNIKGVVFGSADQGEYAKKPYDKLVEVHAYSKPVERASETLVLQPGFDTQGNVFTGEISDELTVELIDEDNVRAYAYNYDEKYQIKQAKFGKAKTHSQAGNDYDVNVDGYDENGNITGIERYDEETSAPRDDFDFLYAYDATGADYCACNRLVSVSNYIDHIGYNKIGQVTSITYHPSAEQDNILIEYDVTGKVTTVTKYGTATPLMQITYDDRGFRHKKIIEDEAEYYIRDAAGQVMAIYSGLATGTNIAQKELPIYGSGKLGMAFKNPDHYKFIYELTDHLGNVRALVTKLALLATATMEMDSDPNGVDEYEAQYFDNLIVPRQLDAANSHSGQYTAFTNRTHQVGPTTTLNVKAGDVIKLDVYVKEGATSTGTTNPFMLDLLEGSVNDAAVGVEGGLLTDAVGNNLGSILAAVQSSPGETKAYLQYILFDESFNVVKHDYVSLENPSGIQGSQTWIQLSLEDDVTEDGYLYAYVINESNVDVYFDDFTVDLQGTRVIRKSDFYPFGAMAKVWNNPDQTQQESYRHDYQGQYAEKDTVTGWNSFELRMYDPLIGRFLSVDPARQFYSSYTGMGNNPMIGIDPTGGICPTCPEGSQYDQYRNADQLFNFAEGIVFNGQEVTVSAGFGGVIDASTAVVARALSTENSGCHNCNNVQNVHRDLSFASNVSNTGSFAYTLGTLQNGSPQAQFLNRSFLLTGIMLDAASKDLLNNTQDQVDFGINTSSAISAYYIPALAPIAAYINNAAANKETIIEITEMATESYQNSYKTTQETTNIHLRIQQEAMRKRQAQRQNQN